MKLLGFQELTELIDKKQEVVFKMSSSVSVSFIKVRLLRLISAGKAFGLRGCC